MRQVSIVFLLIFSAIICNLQPAFSAIKGGINYSIPTDYSKIKEDEVNIKVTIKKDEESYIFIMLNA